MLSFQEAIEARDIPAVVEILAPDVTFRSPVVFRSYHGRDAVVPLLYAIAEVFENFRYTRPIDAQNDRDHALVFGASIGGCEVEGCDFIHLNDDGLVDELVVMVRPLSGVIALAEAMGARLAQGNATPARG